MHSRPNTANRHLTQDPVILTSQSRSKAGLFKILLLFILAALFGAAVLYYVILRAPEIRLDSRVTALQEELAHTRAELETTRMDLEISTVAHEELERQLAVLTERHKVVREELEFIKSAGSGAAK